MMQIVRRYECSTAAGVVRHYAQVRLDDGSIIELGAATPLPDAGWLALAAIVTAPIPPPTSPYRIEAEDGYVCEADAIGEDVEP